MPNLNSNICFPTLSRSAAPSPASPTAPSRGQGEVIGEDARSKFSRFSNCAIPAECVFANDSCRHVALNLEGRSDHCIQRDFGENCRSVGNGGCSKNVCVSSGDIGGPALASASSAGVARGGKGALAESTRVGTGRSIGAAKGEMDGKVSSVETGGTV